MRDYPILTFSQTRIPALYDLSADQHDSGSFWTCAFLTTTTGRQYLSLQHILGSNSASSVCKSSILDLSSKQYWNDLTYCEPTNETTAGTVGVHLDSYGFGATSEDKISSMYAFGAGENYSYDLQFAAKSKVLLNGGNGVITFGLGFVNSTEWAIPSMRTTGTVTLNDRTEAIDPKRSFTWYDRQAGFGAPRNWTWFQLHFPGSEIKASIWAYDLVDTDTVMTNRFATVRFGEESHLILAYNLHASDESWTSPNTNITYPLRWTLEFENGDKLFIASVRPDQEMYGPRAIGDSVYAGFVTAKGRFLGQRVGYGVVEMITLM
ncbi:uncharacterized protein NECHADRAFT_34615 [Fusarium vanettenii 77-13-4]|uniref:AttH domain-containing protein n=1 Tax=Fusarium vanettenii (strain ATCC MYA-4622 / CBS 123669 / FGSC 9596 / NRRL 45880 / 77-13-4) TaxID=660122 RepID=C7ZCQ3_FUSV7|nr:uncharacterized protein NECHADRAFT_34615 [Fusarium vanettenii 77-13-4]EEU38302.1 hypothetical protein NECHADRAFT_34615 [Fusarium vanettenii 77-13-4]